MVARPSVGAVGLIDFKLPSHAHTHTFGTQLRPTVVSKTNKILAVNKQRNRPLGLGKREQTHICWDRKVREPGTRKKTLRNTVRRVPNQIVLDQYLAITSNDLVPCVSSWSKWSPIEKSSTVSWLYKLRINNYLLLPQKTWRKLVRFRVVDKPVVKLNSATLDFQPCQELVNLHGTDHK